MRYVVQQHLASSSAVLHKEERPVFHPDPTTNSVGNLLPQVMKMLATVYNIHPLSWAEFIWFHCIQPKEREQIFYSTFKGRGKLAWLQSSVDANWMGHHYISK